MVKHRTLVISHSSANRLILIDASEGEMFEENKYDGSVYYVFAGKQELSISVSVNAG